MGEVRLDPVLEHDRCRLHRAELLASNECGCFYCLALFTPGEIDEWCDEGETALCPRCGIDSVIPARVGVDVEFLRRMHRRWF